MDHADRHRRLTQCGIDELGHERLMRRRRQRGDGVQQPAGVGGLGIAGAEQRGGRLDDPLVDDRVLLLVRLAAGIGGRLGEGIGLSLEQTPVLRGQLDDRGVDSVETPVTRSTTSMAL